MQTITKIDNIKNLFQNLTRKGSKKEFMVLCASEFDLSIKYLRNYWFSGYSDWSIPEEKQDEVVTLLQNFIKQENTH